MLKRLLRRIVKFFTPMTPYERGLRDGESRRAFGGPENYDDFIQYAVGYEEGAKK